jgi:arginase family enzyme
MGREGVLIPMNLVVIGVPYTVHAFQAGAETAPATWQDAGLMERLAPLVDRAIWVSLQAPDIQESESDSMVVTACQLRDTVRTVHRAGAIPLVLGGDPGLVALGSVAGLQQAGPGPGIAWFDGHNRLSKGEVLGLLLGKESNSLCQELEIRPSPEWQVLHVGDREPDLENRIALDQSAVSHWKAQDLDSVGASELGRDVADWPSVYLHLDLSVLHPGIMPAVNKLLPGGLSMDTVIVGIESIAAAGRIAAIGISGYNPRHDSDGLGLKTSLQAIGAVVAILGI